MRVVGGIDVDTGDEVDGHVTDKLTGSNLAPIKKELGELYRKVAAEKSDRAETNANIASLRARAEALGIPKAAFDLAMRYADWDEDKRRGFDLAYTIAREAMGVPMEPDLFDGPGNAIDGEEQADG